MMIPYRIHTQRLVVRCYDPTDAPLLKAAVDASIDHLLPWLPWARDEPQTLREKIDLIRRFRSKFDSNDDFVMAILNRGETELVGGTGLHRRGGRRTLEIGYWIASDHEGQGYATETTAALTRAAFELHGAIRVEIRCDPLNSRSAAIPDRLGFRMEGILRSDRVEQEIARDTMVWAMIDADFDGSPAAAFPMEAFDVLGVPMR